MLNVSLLLVKKSEYVTYSCMVSKGYIVYCLTALTCNQPIYKLLMLRRLFSNLILNQKQIKLSLCIKMTEYQHSNAYFCRSFI